jgi:hypothetical protein
MTYPNNVFGYGILNVYKAYLLAKRTLTTPVVEKKTKSFLHVFPNPGKQIVWFECDPADYILKITLVNLQGQMVIQRRNIKLSLAYLDISELPVGMYYYKVESQRGVLDGKLLVNH